MKIFKNKYFIWTVLMIPAVFMLAGLINGKGTYNVLMHATGEFSARFLIIALIATPIAIIFPKLGFGKWLVRNRRYFGVASFAYAFLHTLLYLIEIPASEIWAEAFEWGMLTAWIAFIIYVPLAVTSNDAAVRWLKKKWKPLQRWVYLAALMVLLHWMLIHHHYVPALVHFAPVALLQLVRVVKK